MLKHSVLLAQVLNFSFVRSTYLHIYLHTEVTKISYLVYNCSIANYSRNIFQKVSPEQEQQLTNP